MKFADRLYALMINNNVDCSTLGKAIKVYPSVIDDLCNGTESPDIDILIDIADFFNVSIDYLVGRTDKETGIECSRDFDLENPEIIILNQLYERLAKPYRCELLGFAFGLFKQSNK